MICIDPQFRQKGLAQHLIKKHLKCNSNQSIIQKTNILCLNTRRSNTNAINLYKKMGYEHIGYIINKYYLPSEDSVFMIKKTKK